MIVALLTMRDGGRKPWRFCYSQAVTNARSADTGQHDRVSRDLPAVKHPRGLPRPANSPKQLEKMGSRLFSGESRMVKPFNAFEAAILKALTEALFHGVDMAITPEQVVDNIQRQFSWFHGNMPRQISLSLWVIWFVLGGPFFHLCGPAWRARRVAKQPDPGSRPAARGDLCRLLRPLAGRHPGR